MGLETVFMPSNPEELLVTCSDVNRPGLALGGYYDYFDSDRIQVLGKSEHGFLEALAYLIGNVLPRLRLYSPGRES